MDTKVLRVMLTGWLALTVAASAVEIVTAKQALAKANKSVEASVRDLVVIIKGYDADTLLRPRIWDISLYDPTRPNNVAVVRIKDGASVNVASGLRLFDGATWNNFGRNFTGYMASEIVDLSRWALDSDKVLAKALHHSRLDGLEVTDVRLVLRKPSDGNVAPLWHVELRARPKNDPQRDKWIGRLAFSADSGELIADELQTERVR